MQHKHSNYYLYAITKPSNRTQNNNIPLIGSDQDVFSLAIGSEPYHSHSQLHHHYIQVQLVEQE